MDFTSLLDVTLIVIFFFVIFSHMENLDNAAKTEEKLVEMEKAIENADAREREAADLIEQLQDEIDIVQDANGRAGSNVVEMLEFDRGTNLKLILEMENAEWTLKVVCKNENVNRITKSDDIAGEIRTILLQGGYADKNTVLCDFVYDGSEAGTVLAYRTIIEALEELQGEYKYLYFSETDLSVGEE